jgi:hypothetical protein
MTLFRAISIAFLPAIVACGSSTSAPESPAAPAERTTGALSCAPDGVWTFTTEGRPGAGQGCGPAGASAQGAVPRSVRVTTGADGTLLAEPIQPDMRTADGVTITSKASGPTGACVLELAMTFHYDLPREGTVDRSTFQYADTLVQGPGNTLVGTGHVETSTTLIDSAGAATVQSDCREATASTGTFEPRR